jgi:hypothetical protein
VWGGEGGERRHGGGEGAWWEGGGHGGRGGGMLVDARGRGMDRHSKTLKSAFQNSLCSPVPLPQARALTGPVNLPFQS